MKKEDAKTPEQQKYFNVYDDNVNNVIDQYEYKNYKLHMDIVEDTNPFDFLSDAQKAEYKDLLKKHPDWKGGEVRKDMYIYGEVNCICKHHLFDSFLHLSYSLNEDELTENIEVSQLFNYNKDFPFEARVTTFNGKNINKTLYNENSGKIFKQTYYSDNKVLTSFSPELVKNLIDDINSKNFKFIPTTGEHFKEHIEQITPENVVGILDSYNIEEGKSLFKAILSEFGLSKNEKINYIEHILSCLEEQLPKFKEIHQKYMDYVRDKWFPNSDMIDEFFNSTISKKISVQTNTEIQTKIKNPYYEGKDYQVEEDTKNNCIILTNKETNEKTVLDFNKLFKNFTIGDRMLMEKIKLLPAEVLVDIANEVNFVYDDEYFKRRNSNNVFEEIVGRYSPKHNNISLANVNTTNLDDIVHELGHALDYMGIFFNTSSFKEEEEFNKTFEKELQAYIDAGHEQFASNNRISGLPYCTKSITEMFAECYTLLMLGKCIDEYSANIIEEFFPDTLANVKKHMEYIRSQPQFIRN